jgi:23S rRNA pseudouridine2457 synthase
MEIELSEGKFHQVRKMMTAIGHTCKRLIRLSIEDLSLEELGPGEVREEPEWRFFEKLHLQA